MTEINFKIFGEHPQVLEINLEPQKTLIGNGAALFFMDEEIIFQVRDTDGAEEVVTEEEVDVYEDEEEEDFEDEIDQEILEGIEEDEEMIEHDEEEKKNILDKFLTVVKKRFKKTPKKENKENSFIEDFDGEENPSISEPEPIEETVEPKLISITHFENKSEFVRKIAFAPILGKVLPINLSLTINNEVYIRKENFLCARKGTVISEGIDTNIKIHQSDTENLIFSKVTSTSNIFIQAEQSFIVKKIVETGEEDDAAIRVNLGSLLAFETSLRVDFNSIETVKHLYSDEEVQTILLKGTGNFWLQTNHFQQTIHRLTPYIHVGVQDTYKEPAYQEEIYEEGGGTPELGDIDDVLKQDIEEEPAEAVEMEWSVKEDKKEEKPEGPAKDNETISGDFDPNELEGLAGLEDLDLKKLDGDG